MATTTRIDPRIDREKKHVIAPAAKLAGQSVTQYVLSLVWPDAQQRVADATRLRSHRHEKVVTVTTFSDQ